MNSVLTDLDWVPVAAAGAGVLLLILLLLIRSRRKKRGILQRLKRASVDMLTGFVVPDGDDGFIHIEYALLTPEGVLVVDIKDVQGNVFGSDSMQDWTVISDQRRFTFSNPQFALFDRLAAIKRLVGSVPVRGVVAFTDRAEFTKGQPSNVVLLDELISDMRGQKQAGRSDAYDSYVSQWDLFRETVVTGQVDHLLKT